MSKRMCILTGAKTFYSLNAKFIKDNKECIL